MTDSQSSKQDRGPREPDNSMVICPNCTCQFVAISVNDQKERVRLITANAEVAAINVQKQETIERLRAALDMINMLACYASEENTDSREAVLLQIGKLARGDVSPAVPTKSSPDSVPPWAKEGLATDPPIPPDETTEVQK